MTTKALCLLLLTACLDTDADDTLELDQEVRTTSVSTLPNQTVLANLDDAPGTNLLQYAGNRLFVTRADAAGSPVMHHYFEANISQLIAGDFLNEGHDQVCAKLTTGWLECVQTNAARDGLAWWFTQPTPFGAGEQMIVGDFDGDGKDDILAYDPAAGSLRLYVHTILGFVSKPFSLGNLAQIDLHDKQLYAGEFGQVAPRADLLVVDPVARNVRSYATQTENGLTTFWWGWTTGNNALVANEQVTIANIEGGTKDGLVLRDPATGRIRLMRAALGTGYLEPVPATAVTLGNLPVTTHSASLAAAQLPSTDTEPGGAVRDDILFFDRTDGTMQQLSARHDGTRMTYYWSYSKATPAQTGWTARPSNMALVLCKLADYATFEPSSAEIQKRITKAGTGSIRDFLFEVSYGSIDIQNADVIGWVQSPLRASDSSARKAPADLKTRDYLDSCMAAAGITSAQYGGRVLVIVNADNSTFQGEVGYGATSEYDDLLANKLSPIAHEMLHAFGLQHAHDTSGNSCSGNYCDTSDVMGLYNTWFWNPQGYLIGPGLNAMHLDQLGVIPASRTIVLDPATAPASRTITLAAVERPEQAGTLLVKVKTSSSTYYTIALRKGVAYDRNVPTGVQIHRMDAATSTVTLLQAAPAKELQPGQLATAGSFLVVIDSFDAAKNTATITIAH